MTDPLSWLLQVLAWPILPILLWPPLALVPAAGFAVWCFRRAQRARHSAWILGIAAVVWLAFAGYESAMHAWAQTVIAPIRIDLLAIVPLLWLATIAGLLAGLAGARNRVSR